MPPIQRKRPVPEQIFRFFSSYALAAIIMALLLIVTFFGTWEQQFNGLYHTQLKWFDSFFATSFEWKEGRHFPLILPGGYLLMIVLSINILCGALIKARKSWRAPGMIIAHASILFMLLAGLVSFYGKVDGAMNIWEGDTSNKFEFFHERVVRIEKFDPANLDAKTPAKRESWIIPLKYFEDLEPEEEGDVGSKGRKFFKGDLPFELTLFGFHRNSVPVAAKKEDEDAGRAAEGFVLRPVPPAQEDEANRNGIYISVKPTADADGTESRHILWEGSRDDFPLTLNFGADTYLVSLKKDHRILPFEVTLNEANRELHPGTERPKEFWSEITHTGSDGVKEDHTISMNVPLREDGWILFQSQFGSAEAVEGAGIENSTLQVVSNPSDHWPLYSLIAATIGLLIHFVQKLVTYIIRAARRRESLPQS